MIRVLHSKKGGITSSVSSAIGSPPIIYTSITHAIHSYVADACNVDSSLPKIDPIDMDQNY